MRPNSTPMPAFVPKVLVPLLLMATVACVHSRHDGSPCQDAGSPYRDLRTVPEGTIVDIRTGYDVD